MKVTAWLLPPSAAFSWAFAVTVTPPTWVLVRVTRASPWAFVVALGWASVPPVVLKATGASATRLPLLSFSTAVKVIALLPSATCAGTSLLRLLTVAALALAVKVTTVSVLMPSTDAKTLNDSASVLLKEVCPNP
ncbi:Uncharacterised protein [Serratia quinivorans]|nr:Uncharacterised protein [Serratia quinivorans]